MRPARAAEDVRGMVASRTGNRDGKDRAGFALALDLFGDGEASRISGVCHHSRRYSARIHGDRLRRAADRPASWNGLGHSIGARGHVGEDEVPAGAVEGLAGRVARTGYGDGEGGAGFAQAVDHLDDLDSRDQDLHISRPGAFGACASAAVVAAGRILDPLDIDVANIEALSAGPIDSINIQIQVHFRIEVAEHNGDILLKQLVIIGIDVEDDIYTICVDPIGFKMHIQISASCAIYAGP